MKEVVSRLTVKLIKLFFFVFVISGERLVGGEAHQEAYQVDDHRLRVAPKQLPACGRIYRFQGKLILTSPSRSVI
jgi:hypothetical protein